MFFFKFNIVKWEYLYCKKRVGMHLFRFYLKYNNSVKKRKQEIFANS